jgi:hypothetical protein
MSDYQQLFVCDCNNLEHQMVLTKDSDDEFYYISIYLAPYGLWRRLANAFLYLVGRRGSCGCFQEIVLGHDKAERLAGALMQHAAGKPQ